MRLITQNKLPQFLLFIFLAGGVFLLGTNQANAVGNAYFPQATTVALDVGNFTISDGSDADTVTTTNTTVTVTISTGQSFTLESSDRKLLINDSTYSYECLSDKSSITITSTTTRTVIITPSSTSCGSAGGSGGGGGGGGGTITATPTPTPTVSPTPTPTSSPTPTPVSTPQPAAGAYNFTRSLYLGLVGVDVKALQNYLTTTGHFKYSGGSTGIFGPVTQTALAAWQKDKGVSPAVGYFGPVSKAKYSELVLKLSPQPSPVPTPTPVSTPQPAAGAYNFTRSLYLGLVGVDVKALQNYLTTTGHFKYSGGSTGIFGPVTQTALAAWQKDKGVSPASGYFGPLSRAKYLELVR